MFSETRCLSHETDLNSNMIHHMLSQLSIFSAVAVLLLLPDSCRGQSAVIGPLQPIVASVGDNVTLPCHLEPAVDAAAITFEWTRADLSPKFVHVWHSGENLMDLQNPAYKDRTSVSEEKLKSGDISLKLSNIKPSDEGKYRCFIPGWKKESFVELVVDAASTFFIVGIDRGSDGVVLDCESRGWYPEPEVFWLDGEGNLLSAGPTETVRGPDDLYTVSSRVTVEKRHSNSFTCRVQQNQTNLIREAQIHVPDDFFGVQSSSSSATTGLSVSLAVCILVIMILGFLLWRQYKTREKKQNGEVPTEEEEKLMKSKLKEEKQELKEENQQELKEEQQKLKEEQQKLKEEQQSREEAENRVQILEELQKKNRELQEEKKKREEEVQRKNQELQEKTDQMEEHPDEAIKKLLQERRDKEKAQSEVKMLKDQLESKNKEWERKFREEKEKREKEVKEMEKQLQDQQQKAAGAQREWERKFNEEKKEREKEVKKLQTESKDKQAEVQQLQQQLQKMESGLQTLMEDLDSDTLELSPSSHSGRGWSGLIQSFPQFGGNKAQVQSVPLSKWPEMLRQKFQEKLQKKITELQEEQNRRDKAEKDVLKKDLQYKTDQKLVSSSLSQNSTRRLKVDVKLDLHGRYFQLKNTSNEEQQLGCWNLKIEVKDNKPVIHQFTDSFNLKAYHHFTVGCCGYDRTDPPAHLVLKDLQPWSHRANLQVSLISYPGKIQYNLDLFNER